ncbi:MAG: hypothetical protein LLG04_15425, partial [Parachlamydia sp.]|nr:hypothetical protein [Parachlamydia sp.]
HGILAEITSFLEMYDKKTLDKLPDTSLIGKSSGCNNLQNWKADLKIAKTWLAKDKLLGPVESKMIEALQKTKDMREFCMTLNSLTAEEHALLAKRAVQV